MQSTQALCIQELRGTHTAFQEILGNSEKSIHKQYWELRSNDRTASNLSQILYYELRLINHSFTKIIKAIDALKKSMTSAAANSSLTEIKKHLDDEFATFDDYVDETLINRMLDTITSLERDLMEAPQYPTPLFTGDLFSPPTYPQPTNGLCTLGSGMALTQFLEKFRKAQVEFAEFARENIEKIITVCAKECGDVNDIEAISTQEACTHVDAQESEKLVTQSQTLKTKEEQQFLGDGSLPGQCKNDIQPVVAEGAYKPDTTLSSATISSSESKVALNMKMSI